MRGIEGRLTKLSRTTKKCYWPFTGFSSLVYEGTNINDAVLMGVRMLRTDILHKLLPEKSLSMIILLTDGHGLFNQRYAHIHYTCQAWICEQWKQFWPYNVISAPWIFSVSKGMTDPTVLQKNVREAIGGNMTLFSLGFGFNLNYGLLDGMAKQNNGLARRIYEASDAALQLQVNCTSYPLSFSLPAKVILPYRIM